MGPRDELPPPPEPALEYEPPRILWSEPYQPLSFGASCAKQPGNPGCNPGPFSS
jgi:hypothetical protein